MNPGTFRHRYESLRQMTDERLRRSVPAAQAADLRDGCRFVLEGGGKRVRAVLVMLSCQAVGGRARHALDAAAAVEIMHNFTLVHDDIMDHADERRGRPTVHRKWDVNNALLVGDVLVGAAYGNLLGGRGHSGGALARVLTRGFLEVCDGQALDLEYERNTDVTVQQYFRMIEKKTGALIATAAELGGLVGGGTRAQVEALRRFGLRLGVAFQIQDDLLDVVADPRDFGKAIGGDILGGKRTFLLLTAAARAKGKDKDPLERTLRNNGSKGEWKSADGTVTPAGRTHVETVRAIYERYGVLKEAARRVRRNTLQALAQLERLPASGAREMLGWLAEEMSNREK